MAEEKEKAINTDQQTMNPGESKKPAGELSEEELEKATGGVGDYFRIWENV